jgi:hypothetical protein
VGLTRIRYREQARTDSVSRGNSKSESPHVDSYKEIKLFPKAGRGFPKRAGKIAGIWRKSLKNATGTTFAFVGVV